MMPDKQRLKKANHIIATIAKDYEVTVEEILGKQRTANIANARSLSIAMIRIKTNYSTTEIGQIFQCSHSNVIASTKRVDKELKLNPDYRYFVQKLSKNLNL